MTTLHVGAVVERPPGPKYQDALAFAELALRPPLPRPATLAKIPPGLASNFALSLRAPRECFVSELGPLRMDEGLEGRITWLGKAAEAAQACAVVVPTLSDVRTGPRDRERLQAYFEVLGNAMGDTPIVWEPGGLWEAEDALPFAEGMGVVCAFDPLEVRVRHSGIAYLHVKGIGARTRLGEGSLTMVVDAIEELEDAETIYVAIESPRSVREATRLRQLVGR